MNWIMFRTIRSISSKFRQICKILFFCNSLNTFLIFQINSRSCQTILRPKFYLSLNMLVVHFSLLVTFRLKGDFFEVAIHCRRLTLIYSVLVYPHSVLSTLVIALNQYLISSAHKMSLIEIPADIFVPSFCFLGS